MNRFLVYLGNNVRKLELSFLHQLGHLRALLRDGVRVPLVGRNFCFDAPGLVSAHFAILCSFEELGGLFLAGDRLLLCRKMKRESIMGMIRTDVTMTTD